MEEGCDFERECLGLSRRERRPGPSTGVCSSMDRAFDFGSKGWGFESSHA